MPSRITSTTEIFDAAFRAQLERLTLDASRLLRGGMSGVHPSRRQLPAPTFSDHRPYSSGDDLRHVDWFAYARHNELHLKLGETEQDVALHIALDRSASLDWGRGSSHKGRYALRLAGLLGGIGLASGDRVEIWPFHQRLEQPFGPTTGRPRLPDLLRFLSNQPFVGTTDFSPLLRQTRKPGGGMLVLISDFWQPQRLDDLLRQAAPPRWQTVILHLLHPDEIRPTLNGALELEDSETGARMDLEVTPAVLDAYRQRLGRWVRAIEATCRNRGATYVGVRTDAALDRAIIPVLRRRAVLSR